MTVLDVRNLRVVFDTQRGHVQAVNEVTFKLAEGKTLGFVGDCDDAVAVFDEMCQDAKDLGFDRQHIAVPRELITLCIKGIWSEAVIHFSGTPA